METPTDDRILIPEKFYKELEEGMSTPSELVQLHQERRSELGKTLKLDVGPPSELVILANGQPAEARDILGMVLDPTRYASRKCGECYGRGMQTVINHITDERAKQLIAENPTNETFLNQTSPGKWHEKLVRMCACAQRRYRNAYAQFGALLVKEKLAKTVGVRIEGDGYRTTIYELL